MAESSTEQLRIQEFLSQPQFVRFSEVFETYQRLLQKNKTDQEKIKKRMRTIFDEKQPTDETEEAQTRATEFNRMKEQLLSWCEAGVCTKETIAQLIASSSMAEKILEQWRPQKPGRQESGNIAVNEVLEYVHRKEDEDVYINLIPPAIKESELLRKTIEGLHIIAKELKEGALQNVKRVTMVSWLFDRTPKGVERLFGKDIVLTDVPSDTEDTQSVQYLALSHNKRVMAKYLETGEMPTVKQLTMTKEAFIKQFSTQ